MADISASSTSTDSSSTPTRRSSGGNRSAASRSPSRSARASSANAREEDLQSQINELQGDLKQIAKTLSGMAEDTLSDAQRQAKKQVASLAKSGQQAVEDVQDEFGQLERQLKDTIRQKPLTAVAGAIALGFVLAVISR